ncbi:hypothetical protein Poli38472_002684 [Pythium oligandrum]|uniref:Uncharacterized protein n=1 Tax=Pythium oligandrum TaxID=41045 RepID=A0A8K1CJV3_PYTOL|nr:hypothetical protein Poli38472_002684 [Pythium oligandrum]|eukprot:TMW63743.1 hypothetical protein Poli38472_002684 [Pythium oligandrum]
MSTTATATNLSALGQALGQTSISSPGSLGEDPMSPVSLSMTTTAAGKATTGTRKSPKKRERTDSMKQLTPMPAAQRQRHGSVGDDGDYDEEEDDDDEEDGDQLGDEDDSLNADGLSDASASEPSIKLPVKDRTGSAIAGVSRAHLISNAVKTAPPAKEKSNPRRWSKHEDESLRLAVERSGERNWKAIAEQVPGRNHTQCLQRWTKVLKPGLIKGHWDPEEDAKLRELVAEGKRNWGQVASLIPGRTSKQCRERWCNHLDPNINKGAYTEEEDRIILEMQARLGNRWSIIAQQLKGRTEDAVKIRWKSLMRGKKAASKEAKEQAEAAGGTSDKSATLNIVTASATAGSNDKLEDKPAKAKAARTTPTKPKARVPSPVAKGVEVPPPNNTVEQASIPTAYQQPQIVVQQNVPVMNADPSLGSSIDSKHIAASINSYMQNVNDLVAASIQNFKLNQNYPGNVSVGVPTSTPQSASVPVSSTNMLGSTHPSMMAQTTISPPGQPVYSLPPNGFQGMPQAQQAYGMAASYQMPTNLGLPPNYVLPTSGVHVMNGQAPGQFPVTVQAQSSGLAYGYPTGMVNVATSAARPVSIQSTSGYPTASMTMTQPGVTYSSGMPVVSNPYGIPTSMMPQSGMTVPGGPTVVSNTDGLAPVSAALPPHPPSVNSKLATPREEWGSSQTPRSHLIMTEGHASAYELFHQQRLRLMLKEREKGMSLASAPSPGQAMLTKELRANKERQKRQEMMQNGWKSAVEAIMTLNNDVLSMDDNDNLMEKVSLSALDPTDDELLDTTVDISIPPDTPVDVDDPVNLDHV